MENKFKDWLDSKGIKYKIDYIPEYREMLTLNNENDLRPFELELKELFPEIKSVGALDELNSFIGLLRSELPLVGESFDIIQWNLFNAGSAIINDNNVELPNVGESDIKMLEDWMDEMNEELPELKNFIIPKGSKAVSLCHVCRTICRRAKKQKSSLRPGNKNKPY